MIKDIIIANFANNCNILSIETLDYSDATWNKNRLYVMWIASGYYIKSFKFLKVVLLETIYLKKE